MHRKSESFRQDLRVRPQIQTPVGGDMENTEITTIAKNISSLKSIFGDIIEENAELLKYMKRKGVIEEIKKVHKYAISPHSRGFYTKVNDPRPDDPSHRKTIIEPTEEEIYIRLAEWYGLNDRQKKITVDDIYHKWMIRREEEKVEANTRERNDQHYRRYFKGTAFLKGISVRFPGPSGKHSVSK